MGVFWIKIDSVTQVFILPEYNFLLEKSTLYPYIGMMVIIYIGRKRSNDC